MDPVNAVASILTLLQVAAVLAKTATDIYEKLRDAPRELLLVANHLILLQAQLSHLHRVEQDHSLASIDLTTRHALKAALDAARQEVNDIDLLCDRLPGRGKLESRLKWVIYDRDKLEKSLTRLRAIQTSLGVLLQLLTL